MSSIQGESHRGAREPGVAVLILRPLAQSVARLGADPDRFLRALGIAGDTSSDTYVPGGRVVHALRLLEEGRAGEALGLALAQASPLGTLGLFDYLLVTSSSLREALAHLIDLYGMLTERVSLVLTEREGVATLRQRTLPGTVRASVLIEFAFAIVFIRAREIVGGGLGLRSVSFVHEAARAPYEAVFGKNVSFGQDHDEITFDAACLDVHFRTADPSTFAVLEGHAARLQAAVDSVRPVTDRARAAVAEGASSSGVALKHVARALRVSTRTLQRQLCSEGTSHRELVDEVRRERAMQLLARPDMSIIGVAFESGFTKPAAFNRAFRRWTGMTPGSFRARALFGATGERFGVRGEERAARRE